MSYHGGQLLHNPGDRLLCFIVVVFFGGVPRTAWLPLLLLIFPGGSGRPFWAIVSTEELFFLLGQKTFLLLRRKTWFLSQPKTCLLSQQKRCIYMSCVSTEDMSFVGAEDVVLFWSHFGPRLPPHCCCFLSGGPEPVCGHCRRFFKGVVTQDS